MKNQFLFPHRFKLLGWLLFIPAFITSVSISVFEIDVDSFWKVKMFAFADDSLFENQIFAWVETGILDELLLFCLVIGGILIGFSKLKLEDEFTSKIRYESLVWAVYFNYGLVLFFTLFIFGFYYLHVLFYNTFTLLLFFIIRFHYMIFKLNKSIENE